MDRALRKRRALPQVRTASEKRNRAIHSTPLRIVPTSNSSFSHVIHRPYTNINRPPLPNSTDNASDDSDEIQPSNNVANNETEPRDISDQGIILEASANTAQASASTSQLPAIQKQIKKGMRLVLKWSRLVSFLAISGHVHFTAVQYQFMASGICTASEGDKNLCTYKSVRGPQRTFILSHCFPKSQVHFINKNYLRMSRRDTDVSITTFNGKRKDPRDCVRIVLPSEWARLDIVTPPVHAELFNLNPDRALSIEHAPLITDGKRETYLSGSSSLWAHYKNTILPTHINDPVQISCYKLVKYIPDFDYTSWITENTSSNCVVRVRVAHSWCVRSSKAWRGRESTSEEDLQYYERLLPNLPDEELLLFYYTTIATHNLEDFTPDNRKNEPRKSTSYKNLFTFPGDVCVILRPHDATLDAHQSRFVCLLVASFVWREEGRVGERIIWIEKKKLWDHFFQVTSNLFDKNDIQIRNPSQSSVIIDLIHRKTAAYAFKISAFAAIVGLPMFDTNFTPESSLHQGQASNRGYLSDGSPYVVYRFLLYTDGFKQKKSLSDQRSVCGCYIMPVGLPHHCRCSSASARIITLAAHGQDTNEVLEFIVNDIVTGAVTGFSGINPDGVRVTIFLDAVAIIGDYPAVTSGTDLSGHNADSFCSYCAMRKRKGSKSTELLYSAISHSRRLSLVRFDERMKILRAEHVNDALKKHLGTTCSNEEEASSRIAVKLADA